MLILAAMHCIFCGQDRRLSREHVFASWMEEYFPELRDATADYVRRTVTQAEDGDHTRPGPAFDFVPRDVCEVCNNGWMSDLEDQAKPILGPMLLIEARALIAPEQLILGTWATKTMLAMGGVNLGDERVVSDAQSLVRAASHPFAEFARLAVPVHGPEPLAVVSLLNEAEIRHARECSRSWSSGWTVAGGGRLGGS